MRVEQRIETAEKEYLHSVAIIKRMCDIKRGSKALSEEYTQIMKYYESAVQGVILYAMLHRGHMTEAAKMFVQGITITGDFLVQVNMVGPRKLYRKWVNLDWDNLLTSGMPADRLKEIFEETIGICVQSFVYPLAKIDKDISTTDFAAEISKCVRKILYTVCSPDLSELSSGIEDEMEKKIFEAEEAEKTLNAVQAGIKVFNDCFLAFWDGSAKLE